MVRCLFSRHSGRVGLGVLFCCLWFIGGDAQPSVAAQSAEPVAAAKERPARRTAEMNRRIQRRLASFKGKVFCFAKNLDTGETFGLAPDAKVRTASTIKVPIMVEIFAQVAEGKLSWDEKLTVVRRHEYEDGGVLFELTPGTQITVRDAMRLMIVVSDNIATNILLDRITTDAVNARLEKMGFTHIRSLRKIGGGGESAFRESNPEENKKYGIGVATSREMVRLLEALERGLVVSPEASREMLAVMKRQQFRDGIGRRLRGVEIANKPGALDHLRSDIGIVYTKHGRVAMAITIEDIPVVDYCSEAEGHLLIADIVDILLDGLATPPRPMARR
ncbi:MAG: class A beta-lactamase-related serine hydrolase [Chloracidobacterium sp.]|nr:class A beta-lactamase-related serine hydrolase [Chloracidobacterium sp.]MDW8217935.1 serine hydrolase [Acidobacteriota bacterium]